EQVFFDELLAQMRAGLSAAVQSGALDGVYISEHGAGLATELDDADGAVFDLVRQCVGPDVPVVATLDLHAHVTARMLKSTDALIAFLTNPHVDQLARGREAAEVILQMHDGMQPVSHLVRVPMISPSTCLLTAQGPYADLIAAGQALRAQNPAILNVSILAGFAPANASTNGMSVVVTARDNLALAQNTAKQLAQTAWADRCRYVADLTSVSDAVELAARATTDLNSAPVLMADVADNPGGGGRGNTTYLLRALHEQGVRDVVIGMMFDAPLAEQAHKMGVGASFLAQFNRAENTRFSDPYEGQVVVEGLVDGPCVGRRGLYAGRRINQGKCALLNLDGIQIVVVSRRQQCADPVFLERLGIDLATTRALVIKSRGHFRAGFDEFFKPEQIVEVDAPGLTTPDLGQLTLDRVPRPMYPLDRDMTWDPTSIT
ncbi:MAG: M81 family metallopeptidase, partial [Burkholderiaceae bacterium]